MNQARAVVIVAAELRLFQVYWHGVHSRRLEQIVDSAVRAVSGGASG